MKVWRCEQRGAVSIGRPSDVRSARTLVGVGARVRLDGLGDEAVAVADSLVA